MAGQGIPRPAFCLIIWQEISEAQLDGAAKAARITQIANHQTNAVRRDLQLFQIAGIEDVAHPAKHINLDAGGIAVRAPADAQIGQRVAGNGGRGRRRGVRGEG